MKPMAHLSRGGVPVAPRAGAWIETGCPRDVMPCGDVAPRAGAWIETFPSIMQPMTLLCRPPRGGVD